MTTVTRQRSARHVNAAARSALGLDASVVWEEPQWTDPRTTRSGRPGESGARAGFQRGGLTKRLSRPITMENCRRRLHRRL